MGVPGAGPVLKHLHPDTRLLTYCYETGPVLDELVDEAMLDRLNLRGLLAMPENFWDLRATDQVRP